MKHLSARLTALALTLALCALPTAVSAAPGDGPSSWAKEDVETAYEQKLHAFYGFDDFQQPITRAQFADLAVRLYRSAAVVDYSERWTVSPFTDTDNYNVSTAHALGLMNGVSDTTFAPLNEISRMEICVLFDRILEALALELPTPNAAAADDLVREEALPDWAAKGVRTAVAAGLMTGTDKGYNLKASASIEEAVLLSLRASRAITIALQSQFTAEEQVEIDRLRELTATLGTDQTARDNPFSVQPSTTAPLSPGELSRSTLDNGLNAINYARTLAGLPADVTDSDTKNKAAQAGALLLQQGYFGHTPAKPAGMEESLYQLGYSATSKGNIGSGYSSLHDFNLSCMDDSDTTNMDRVGHRRWLLSPNLKVVGMGMAGGRTTTMVFDTSRSPAISPDQVCWPNEGLFPKELFHNRLAWSCSLSEETYDLDSAKNLTVTVTRERDGAVFALDQSMNAKAQTGPYLVVETANYGHAPAVIFRPGLDSHRSGDVFQVRMEKVPLVNGGTTTIEYTVKLFPSI